MSSLRDLVKRANGINVTNDENKDEKKPSQNTSGSRSSLSDLVKKANTVRIGSNLTSEQVSTWYSNASNIAKRGYAYLSADGYRKRDDFTSDAIDSYLKQADDVAVYLRANKDKISNYDDMMKSHYDMVDYLRSIRSGVNQVGNYYSKWENEEDYQAAVKQWQEYYEQWGHYADEADFEDYAAKGAAIQNPSVSEAEGYAYIFGWRPGAQEVGNIVTYSRDNYNDIVRTSEGGRLPHIGNLLYNNMTDDDVKLYNYLLAKEGKEVADSYLSYLEPQLKQAEGQRLGKLITDIDIPVLEDLAVLGYGFGAGVDQWGSGARQFFTNEEQSPSVTQYANAYISDSLDGVGYYTHSAATTIGNMAPSILVSTVAGGLGAPVKLAQAAGAATIGVSAAGNAYQDALSKGYDKESARIYSTLVGASEGGLQYLIGGIGKLGGIGTEKIMAKVAMIDDSLLRISAKLGVDLLGEIGEEELQNYLEPAFRMIILGEDYDAPTIDELLETAIVTAITTPILGGMDTIMKDVAESKHYSESYGNFVQDLVLQGLESPEGSLSRDLATKYQAKLDAGNELNGHQIGRMVKANEQQFRYDDMATIQSAAESRLSELGETGDVSAIAKALAKQAAGEKLSRAEQTAIANSKYGQRVANELNTENIRSGDYSSDWAQKLDTNRINVDEYSRLVEAAQLPQETTEVAGYRIATEAQKTAQTPQAAPVESVAETVRKNRTVETAHEGNYEVSADGKTIDSKGNIINIVGVDSVDDGKLILKTEDGTISSDDVVYATKDDALIYEAVASTGAKPDSAWTMINGFKESDGVSAQDYAELIPVAYEYGKLNYKNGLPSLGLTSKQKDIAFQMGRNDAATAVKTSAQASTESTITEKNADKKIIFEGFNRKEQRAIKAAQKASMAAIDMINKMSSLEIHVYKSYEKNGKLYAMVNGKERLAPNGYFTDGNKIYIDINAGQMKEGLMLYTLSHEVGHYIAKWNAQDFKAISDFLFEHYGENVPIYDLLDTQKNKLKKSYELDGEPLPSNAVLDKLAQEELVCDMLSRMLADKNAYDTLMELKQKDLNVFQKLGQAIKKVLDKISKAIGFYDTKSPDFQVAASVETFGEEVFRQLQDLYMKAFVQADANYQAAEAQKNTTENGGVMYEIREIGNTGKFYVQADRQVITGDDPTLWGKQIESYINEQIRKEQDIAIPTADGHILLLTSRSAYKLKDNHVASIQKKVEAVLSNEEYARKGRAATHIDELIQVARFNGYEADLNNKHENDIGEDGFNYFDSFFRDFDGSYYLVPLSAALNEQEETAYSIGKIRKRSFPADTGSSSKQEALKNGRKASGSIIYTSEAKSQEVKTAVQLAYEKALKKKGSNEEATKAYQATEEVGLEVDADTDSVAPSVMNSERTWTESDYVQEREQAAKEIAKAIGVSVKKAKAYIDSVNSIAKMIAEDRVRLDYFSSPGRSSFVGNVEYGGSFDFSTLCKKRRLLTGTFTAIQKALPNTALTADEILDIRNRMKDAGLEVRCGLCYVEGSRANMGQFAKEFLKLYKQYYPDAWQPNMADVNTPDGIEWVRINHPECYEQYEYFWNHYGTLKPGDKNLFASQQKPKLYQLHTEYKGEILDKFNDDDNVEEKNLNGGIRLQSFSDFEIVHLIDTMQIIMDMSKVGLAGQAYTKVPDFAWALGDTGLKINLSLIAKGVDENGKLIFDDVEGMPIDTAVALRNRYSKNVGTILVAFNDEQLLAAMADDRVDFIIPFHRSQWKKSQYEAMGLPAKTKDYTYMQNEKFIKPQYHEYRGRMVKDKATNYMPNEYWDFSKSGKENAEAYLEMCARNNKRPKFYKLLQNNGNGSYSLKADGSTDGYWKLLIDFKMYDNDGKGSPQLPVKPEFNMDEAQRMLNDYQGGHSNFPVAQGVVDSFVKEYKDSHKGALYSDRDSDYMAAIKRGDMATAQKMVDEAAKAAGYTIKAYHGTPSKFTSFDTNIIYFTANKKYAAEYGENVLSLYVKADNPYISKDGVIVDEDGNPFLDDGEEVTVGWLDAVPEALDYLVSKGYDAAWDEDMEFAAVFYSENVKSADPVTYDYDGKAIPLSERFNKEHQDIRFQDRTEDSVSNRSLLANAFEGIALNEIEKNKIQEYRSKVELINAEERKLSELNAQIKELSFAKGPRDTKKIRSLQLEANQAANRINTYDKQLLRLEASKPLQDVLRREKRLAYKKAEQRGKEALANYKSRVEAKQKETTEKWRESRKAAVAKARETAEKRDARAKLQKLVLDTVKWISYPTKTDVKCPDILKQPYADFLNGIDLSSKRAANGGDPTKNDLRLANAMGSLATALDRIMTAQDPTQETDKVLDTGYLDLPVNFVKQLRDMTENIKAIMVEGDYVVNSMTAAEVRQLSQMIRTLNHAIKTMSNLYANLRFANVEALGVDTMDFVDALGEIEKTGGMKDFVEWDNALPYYAFKRFGKGGESVFEGLMDAQDKLAFLAQKIFDFQEKAWTGKEAKAWSEDTHTITLPNGKQLTLTTADAMSIYCLSRREQGLQHLLGGGTRVMGLQKGSKKAKDSRSILTIEDISAINSSLTDRQKQVAEAIQEFMSTVCSEWGNEISMKRFLTKEFTEKFYFPIESNDENLPTKDPAAQQSDLFRLLNISATKPLTPGANNEVIIRNIFDVFTGHASDMARLNAYGMALLDYMKWLNYREKTATEEGQINVRGVRKSMEMAYGNAAKSYVLNLVKDVNGRPSDGGDPNILMKWMRAAKTASVGSSFRVATLQITSYPRAALVLSPKSLALGLSKMPNIEKAKKYCGIALWKSFGFYDTNISRSIEDQMKGIKDVKQKLIELSLKGAEWGDAITWGALWNACEYEVAQTTKNKVGSEEFYQEVGKKLREVVYRTQVVDSTLTRSQIMRSKRGMAQEAAAFMSEPTLSANILMDAGFEFNAEKRRTGSAKAAWNKTGKYIGRAVAVYAIGQLTAALLEGFWDAWRDDDDEEFGKKYLDAFVENLVLDLVPFNKIPIVSDVFEAALAMFDVGFYSSDKMSTTWLTQAVSAVDAWKDALSGESSVTVYNALYKTTRAISSFFGVSISGVMREGVALWNNTAGAYDATLKILTYDRSKEELGNLLLDAYIEGNDRQAESLQAKFEDESSRNSAVRTAVKKRYKAGDIDADTTEKYLVNYGGLEADDAYWKIQEWSYETESGEDFHKYDNFYEAVKTGKNLKAVIKEYTDNGVDSKTLASQITAYFKPLYKEMTNAERAAIKGYLLNAYVLLGYDRSKKSKDIDKWLED